MTLFDLPVPLLRVCAIVFYLLCFASLFCVILAFRLPSAKTVFVCGLLTALLTFPVTTFLPLYFGRLLSGRPPEEHIRFILSLPAWAAGLLAALSLAAVIWMIARLQRLRRFELTALSLCEGLDQLPDGISYSLPDGFPKLVNSRMQAISNAAFGTGVTDTRRLDERLQSRDLQPGCTVDEDAKNTFLRLPDGKVWRMKQQPVETNGQPMAEMLAFDVTERYNNLVELRQRNERLEKVNRELRGYLENMERIVREREVLAAKSRLHNELGQSLLSIEAYLKEPEGDRDALTNRLRRTILLLQSDAPDQNTDLMEDLFRAAQALDLEIRIDGEIPENLKPLIAVAIHECLTNTVKHARGRMVWVKLARENGDCVVSLTGDGEPPAGPIRETGGLANLRALVERQGGEMAVESAPAFRVILRMKAEGKILYGMEEEGWTGKQG